MNRLRVQIIDYGVGNIASVANMVRHVGSQAEVVKHPSELSSSSRLILPGVGAFDYGIQALRKGGWIDALNEAVCVHKTPILGICLGMQLMCARSEEGVCEGLGWIDAEVKRFKPSSDYCLKVPHMGWRHVEIASHSPLFGQSDQEPMRFYFVHSYYVQCNNSSIVSATAVYGNRFDAAFSIDNIHGVQFHPEKSHRYGMVLMRNFIEV